MPLWIIKETLVRLINFNLLVWVDNYVQRIIFEGLNLEGKNLFTYVTDFSKYILRTIYQDKFFDFKDKDIKIRVFTFTISIPKNEKDYDYINTPNLKSLFCSLNTNKTIICRASPVILQNPGGIDTNAAILLEFRLNKNRQNFDYTMWKKYMGS